MEFVSAVLSLVGIVLTIWSSLQQRRSEAAFASAIEALRADNEARKKEATRLHRSLRSEQALNHKLADIIKSLVGGRGGH